MAHSFNPVGKIVTEAAQKTPKAASVPREKTTECPEHGPYQSLVVCSIGDQDIWASCPACQENWLTAERKEKAEEAAKEAQRRMERLISKAAVPGRFIGRTFDNFKAANEVQRGVLDAARAYSHNFAKHLAKGDGLIFGGKPGTGKSHLAIAILQDIMPAYVGLYTTCLGMIQEVRGTWRKGSDKSESEMLRAFCMVDLLVLDEVGVQYGTEGEQTIIFDVLDRRYREMKPTIILTNQDASGLRQYIGDRCFDRLRESSRWYTFDWNSYRSQARKDDYDPA